jgi:WD40 repeat protein
VRIIRAHHKRVLALALSSSGLLASAGRDGFLRFWALPQGTPALPERSLLVRSLHFVQLERSLLVLSRDGSCFLVYLDEVTGPASSPTRGRSYTMGQDSFSFVLVWPDQKQLLTFSSGFQAGDRKRQVKRHPIVGPGPPVRIGSTDYLLTRGSLASRRSLFAGSSGNSIVTIHDSHTFTTFRSLQHRLAVDALTFSPDEGLLVVAAGNQVVLWSVERWDEVGLLTLHRGQIRALGCTPDGRTLLTAGLDGQVGSWDLHTFRLREAYQ